jgi:hypothetical protein
LFGAWFGDPAKDPEVLYKNLRLYGTALLFLMGIVVFIGIKPVRNGFPADPTLQLPLHQIYLATSASDSTGTVLISCGKFSLSLSLFHRTLGSFLLGSCLFSSLFCSGGYAFSVSLFPGPLSFFFCPARVLDEHLRRVQEFDNRNRLVREKRGSFFTLVRSIVLLGTILSAGVRKCVEYIYHVVALSQHTDTILSQG